MIMQSICKFMNFSTARKYYYACIYSVITYCISTWGGVIHLSYRGTCLIRTHERIVNLLFRKFYIDNSECIFKKAGILKISDIHRLYVSIYMYKLLKLDGNSCISDCVNIVYPNHRFDTRNSNLLRTPFPSVLSVEHNFEYQFLNV